MLKELVYVEVDANSVQSSTNVHEDDELVSFDDEYKTIHFTKFKKTNQSTTVNIRPIVKERR